ncbi:MAG: hypothetical protein ACKO96_18475, partial [Flammeovirgaceae bacterium]
CATGRLCIGGNYSKLGILDVTKPSMWITSSITATDFNNHFQSYVEIKNQVAANHRQQQAGEDRPIYSFPNYKTLMKY